MHVPLALIFFSVLLLLAIFAAGLIGLSLLFLSGIIIASLTLAFVLGAVTGTVRRVLDRIKTRKYQTIVSEYEAPHRLEPAELGYLLDKRSTQAELIATFIAIAQKGTIRLTVDKHKNIHFVYTGNVSKPVPTSNQARSLICGMRNPCHGTKRAKASKTLSVLLAI